MIDRKPDKDTGQVTPQRRVYTWGAITIALGALLYLSFNCCCYGHPPPPPLPPVATSPEKAAALRKRLTEVKERPGPFTVTIGETELGSYLVYLMNLGAGEFPARDIGVRFSRAPGSPTGYVELWATFIEVAPTDIPTYVRATVEAVDGQIVFHIAQANAGPCAVPGMMRETIAQVLSESLADLDLEITVESVEIQPGQAIISGQITGPLPDLP